LQSFQQRFFVFHFASSYVAFVHSTREGRILFLSFRV
jgi:hypothetical protein